MPGLSPPPAPGQAATGRERYNQTKKGGLEAGPAWPPQLPAREARPTWGARVGAPTARQPFPRAVFFVLPAAQSQPLHAHLVSRPHQLCLQTYLQFDHLAPSPGCCHISALCCCKAFCLHGVLGLTMHDRSSTQSLGQPHQTRPGGARALWRLPSHPGVNCPF